MTSIAISVLVLLALALIVRNLILGIWAFVDHRRIKHSRNKERTRRQFAESRNALVELAMAREVDVKSRSFQLFYHINTAFMRRPDQYREISGLLVRLFLDHHNSSPAEELLAESKNWSPGFKAVVRSTADALGYVVLDYSWFIRLMFRLEKLFDSNSTPFRMLSEFRTSIEEKEKPIIEISQSRRAMYQMADNPLSVITTPSPRPLAHV